MTAEQRTSSSTVRVGSSAAWFAAVRPRSLLVAISPVLVGAALGDHRKLVIPNERHVESRPTILYIRERPTSSDAQVHVDLPR